MALLGRDNHEDLNYSEETTPLTAGFDSEPLFIDESKFTDSKPNQYNHYQNANSSHIVDIGRGEALDHITNLHEDVEKLFELPKKFDITAFSGGANPEKSSYKPDHAEEHLIPRSDSRIFGEDDYTSHRKDSFPHAHLPLKALRSRSHKNVRHLEVEVPKKKKKKKKKKRKMHVSKSFPSKSATMSPTIPEEAAEQGNSDDDSVDSSASSVDLLDDDELDEGRESPELGGGIELTFPSQQSEVDLDDALAGVPPEPETPELYIDEPAFPRVPTDGKVPEIKISEPPGIKFFIGEREMSASPDQTVPMSQKVLSPRDTWGSDALSEVSERSEDPGEIKFTLSDLTDQEPVLSPSASKKSAGSKTTLGENEARVQFSVGGDASFATLPSFEGQEHATKPPVLKTQHSRSDAKIHRHKHRHHHDHYKQEDLKIRRQKGSEVKIRDALDQVPTEFDEANMLHSADLDDMASHRLGKVPGLNRHKITKKSKSAFTSVVHIGKAEKVKNKIFKAKKKYDHSPHEVFVELDELYGMEGDQYEWREKARWIKFEEDVEEGAERWGKPHVASLSFHSLLELRRGLESGSMILDLEAEDLPTIINYVIDDMIVHDNIKSENKGNVLRTLLLKHKHVGTRANAFIRRNISYMNLLGLEGGRHRHQRDKMSLMKSFSTQSFRSIPSEVNLEKVKSDPSVEKLLQADKMEKGEKNDVKNLQFVKVDVDNNMQTVGDGVHIGITTNESRQRNIQDIMRRIPTGAEAITVLVGAVDYLEKPAMAFVRLAEGQVLDNLTEVPLPVRFLFILLGPEHGGMDYHEVGRSISTLMANQHFHDIAYKALSRDELLHAINEFLDESIVLPPGDWDQKTLLPIMDMARKKARVRRRKKQKEEEKMALLKKEEEEKIPSDPIKRTGRLFGGLINDIRRRYPHYASDFKDAMNFQCIAAFIFIFFACFAPCIAFGGLLSEKTDDYMGVTETIVSTAISGIVFGFFSAQPLMIVGATGPVLVFEQSLYKFCKVNGIEFLTLRVWISFWVMVITFVAIALESSFLVRYITRFTEEVFTVLISLVFIYEVLHKLIETYEDHPLMSEYCGVSKDGLLNSSLNNISLLNSTNPHSIHIRSLETPYGIYNENSSSYDYSKKDSGGYHEKIPPQPNTALLTTILTLGTCLIAYFLRIFRNSKFLGRSARRALGDFGVVIALIVMVLLDFSMQDTFTQKLIIPDRFEPTAPNKRGWFVNPLGTKKTIETYLVFAAFLPAFLIFILLFLETQITEMTLNKKDSKMKKGSGYHLDQVLLGIVTFICGLFGLPWMCAATVRTLVHVSALSVMSRTHAPGEKPKLLEVKEQRVTNIMMNAMIGFALLWGPLLRAIPIAVIFGIFLYVGVSALSGLQMFQRMKLLLIPVKHHPSVGFVRRVRTIKMHLFTIIQVILLILLLVIKVSAAALAFPLFVILLIPLRLKLMGFIFTKHELEELDKEEEDSDFDEEDDPDFYRLAHMPV